MALVEDSSSGGGGGGSSRWDTPAPTPARFPKDWSINERGQGERDWLGPTGRKPEAPSQLFQVSMEQPGRSRSSAANRFSFDPSQLTKLTPFAMPSVVQNAAEGSPKTKVSLAFDDPSLTGGASLDRAGQANDPGLQKDQPSDTPKLRTRRTFELSADDYAKLTDDQRAAVDFNTMLVQAREKDLNADYKPSGDQRANYDESVKRMFGEAGGSETFAPETLKVLEQVDFKGGAGDDLDNFLGLKSAISAKELSDFNLDTDKVKIDVGPAVSMFTGQDSVSANLPGNTEQRVASGIPELQEKLAKTHELIQNFQASAAMDRNDDLQFLGGLPNDVHLAPGFGEPAAGHYENHQWVGDERNINNHFQEWFATLADKKNQGHLDEVWSAAFAPLSQHEQQQFMRYIDEQSKNAETYGLPLIEGLKTGLEPKRFRQIVGLEKGDGDGGHP